MKDIKISVIIPIYNTQDYLKECLDSVINQTLLDIEIICIDNNSSDNSKFILQKYLKEDYRISLIELNKNYGAGEARNIGLKIAKGEFISFLDSDDFYFSNLVLESFYHTAINKKVDICGGNMMYLDMQIMKKIPLKREFFTENKFITIDDYLEFGGYFRFIYRTSLIKLHNIFFPNYLRRQDPVWFYKIMIITKNIYVMPIYIYVYRILHKKVEWNDKQILDALKSYEDNFKLLKKHKLFKHYSIELNDLKNKQLLNKEKYLNKEITKNLSKLLINICFSDILSILDENILDSEEKHRFNLIIEKIEKNKHDKTCLIVGFGNLGQIVYKYLKTRNIEVSFILDRALEGLKVNKNLEVISTNNFQWEDLNIDTYIILNTILNQSFINTLPKVLQDV